MALQTVLFLILACASELLSEANSGAVRAYKGAAQLLITSEKSQDVLSDSKSGESSETFRGLKEPIDIARDAELQMRSTPPAVRTLDEPAWRSFDFYEDPSVVRATVTPSEHVSAVSLRTGGSATPTSERRAVNKALGPPRRGPRGEGNPCCDDTRPVLSNSRVAMSGRALRSTGWALLSDEDGGSWTARQRKERHSRQRRSWLWNQFFVIEEYQGPEPVLIGRLHTDMDRGDGRTKYILEGEGVGSVFVIDERTGNIHVTKSLDREEKDQYRLVATATDRQTGHALEPSSQFIIRVQDINDNPPVFKEEPYVATVPEMANIGTSIIQVTATDADDPTYGNSAKLVYAIAQGQQYFSVDPQTGILRTAVPDMDREAQAEYQVILEAKDMGGHLGGMSGTTTVTVRLADVNDNPPRFRRSAWSFSVSELAAPGVEVGRLSATDADLDDNALLDFTILDGEERDTFNISTRDQEAVLVLNKLLDYESRSAYSFTVEVANPVMDARFLRRGPFKDRASVRVMVLNADEPPRFSRARYRLDVSENCPPVCSVGRVSAVDPDTGQSSNIRYSIDPQSDPEALFRIASDTGFITTVTELDREREQWHNITVIATQRDNPNLVTRVVVAIETLDQNDNAPELDRQYTTSVCDSSAPGQVVQMLRAVDKDQGGQDTPPVHFSIPPESSSALNLTIRESGGVTASLVLQSTLQPLPGFAPSLLTLYVPVVLRDGASGLTNTGTVTVTVCPCLRGGMQTEDRGRQRDRGWERHTVCLPLPSSSPSLIFSMVTLLALLACITTMLVVCALSLSLHHRKRDSLSPLEEDEIRENIIRYDDEGGGEADTAAFDIAALQSMHRVQRMQDSRNIWYTQPNAPRARTYSWGRNPRPVLEHRRPGSAPMYGRFCYGVHTLPVLHDCPQGPLEAGLQLTQLGYGLPGSHLANHPPLVIQNQATFDLVEPRAAHIIHPTAAAAAAAAAAEMNPTGRERAEQRLVSGTSSDQERGSEFNSELKQSQDQEPGQTQSTELLLTNKRVTPTFSDPSESSALSQSSSLSTQQEGTPGSSQTHTSTGATSSALDELDTDSSIPSVSERIETNSVGLTDAVKCRATSTTTATLSGRDNYSIVGSLTQRSGVLPGSGSSGGLYPGGAQLLNMYGLGRRDLTPQMPALGLPGGPNRGGGQERAADGVVGAAHSLPLRMEEFLKFRLNQVTSDLSQPPYDSLQTYEFEGRDSRAESLSSLESEGEMEELGEEGEEAGARNGMEELDLKFERLVEIIKERERERERKREQSAGEVLTPVEEERRDAQDNETLKEDTEDGREKEVHTWDF